MAVMSDTDISLITGTEEEPYRFIIYITKPRRSQKWKIKIFITFMP